MAFLAKEAFSFSTRHLNTASSSTTKRSGVPEMPTQLAHFIKVYE